MNGAYRVLAYNTARESENKIHDDEVARRFGFSGGLVPGVDVYAYMVHPAVARWGKAWLERGTAEIRLAKPVYDGNPAEIIGTDEGNGLALRVESGGVVCATGLASLPEAPLPENESPAAGPPPPLPENRPPADERSLAVGTLLAMCPLNLTPEFAAAYVRDVRETDPIYEREGVAHPGLVLRTGNWVLRNNVVLGPWMHVGSTVRHVGLARIGDTIEAHARVSANYERKGHRFVELDVAVLTDGGRRAVARISHIAIYRPRQLE